MLNLARTSDHQASILIEMSARLALTLASLQTVFISIGIPLLAITPILASRQMCRTATGADPVNDEYRKSM